MQFCMLLDLPGAVPLLFFKEFTLIISIQQLYLGLMHAILHSMLLEESIQDTSQTNLKERIPSYFSAILPLE